MKHRDKESEKYLLELGIVGSLSDGVSQRDFSVSKQANLVSSCLKEEQHVLILVSKDNSKCGSCLQVPVSSQSQAVAGSAELLGHRGDESNLRPF